MSSRLNALWKAMPDDVLSILHKFPNPAPSTHDPDNPLDEEPLTGASLKNAPSQLELDLDHGERTGLVKYLLLQAVRELDPDVLPIGWRGDLDRRDSVVVLRNLPRGLMLSSNNSINSDELQPLDPESSWTERDERRLQREIAEREYRRQEAAGESQLHPLNIPRQAGNDETSTEAELNEGLQTPPEFHNFVKGNSLSRQSSFKPQSVITGSPSEAEIGSLYSRDPEWSFEEMSVKPANKAFLHPPHPKPLRGPSSSRATLDHASTRPLRPRSSKDPSSSRTVSDSASTHPLLQRSLNNPSLSGSNTSPGQHRTSLAEHKVQGNPTTADAKAHRQAGKHYKDQKEIGMVQTTNKSDLGLATGSLTRGDQNDADISHGRVTEGEGSAFPLTRPDLFAIKGRTSFRDSGKSGSSQSLMVSKREERKDQPSTVPIPALQLRQASSHAIPPVFSEANWAGKAYVSSFGADGNFDGFADIHGDVQEQKGSIDKRRGKATPIPSSLAALVTSDDERARYVFMSDLKEEEVLNFDELPPRPRYGRDYNYQQVLLDIAALNITPRIRWRMLIELVRVMQYFMDEVRAENEKLKTEDLEMRNLSSGLDRPVSLIGELDHSSQRILRKLQRLPDSVQFDGNHIEMMLGQLLKHSVEVEYSLDLEWDRKASTATTLREARGLGSSCAPGSSEGTFTGVTEAGQNVEGRKESNASKAATQTPGIGVHDEVLTQAGSQCTPSLIGLASLPPELIYEIFSHVVPVDSLLFGLTCKDCYQIHKKCHHRPIPPWAISERGEARGFPIRLKEVVVRMYPDLMIGWNGRLVSRSKREGYKRQWREAITAFTRLDCKDEPEKIPGGLPLPVREPEVQVPQEGHVTEEVQQSTGVQGSGEAEHHSIVENIGDPEGTKAEQVPEAKPVSKVTHRSHKAEGPEEAERPGGLKEHKGVQEPREGEPMPAKVQEPQEAGGPGEFPEPGGVGRLEDVHEFEQTKRSRKASTFSESMRRSRGWSTLTQVRGKFKGRNPLSSIGFGPNVTQQKTISDASGSPGSSCSLGQTAPSQKSWRSSIITWKGRRQAIPNGRTAPPIPGMRTTRPAPNEPVVSSEHIEHASTSASPASNEPTASLEQMWPTRLAVSAVSSYRTASSMPNVGNEIPAPSAAHTVKGPAGQ